MDDKIFEQEVRRVARELWPNAPIAGATNLAKRERDGVFETPEVIYVLEATVSRKKEKIEIDARKTADAVKEFRRDSGKFSKGYIVTLHDPTSDQNDVAKKYERLLEIMSFDQFCTKLIDSSLYLSLRDKMPFGSVQDVADINREVARSEFVEPTVDDGDIAYKLDDLVQSLESGKRYCLIADFGSGKSMLSREVYFRLRDYYLSKKIFRFPIYINLRDHAGAEYEIEILERHARKVGYPEPSHLVRAWRAGFVHLILDGFDELTGRGVSPAASAMREYRRKVQTPVRRLINETPRNAGVLISGRSGFFDTPAERAESLGISGNFTTIYVRPFGEAQLSKLRKIYNTNKEIPIWIPRTPLLLSYLIARGYLGIVDETQSGVSRGKAWIELIDMICRREAAQSVSLDAVSTKLFFERLATRSRSVVEGSGTLTTATIASVFRSIAKREPVDDDWQLILRLPGLGSVQSVEGDRAFINEDLCATGAAGDVCRFVRNPYEAENSETLADVAAPMGELGVEVISEALGKEEHLNSGLLSVALEHACKNGCGQLAVDIIQVMALNALDYTRGGVDIVDAYLPEFDMGQMPLGSSQLQFYSSYGPTVYIPIDVDARRVSKFRECWFGSVIGRVSEADLPKGRFEECIVDRYAAVASGDSAADREYPVALRALTASLRRLFFQAGAGRLEGAFSPRT